MAVAGEILRMVLNYTMPNAGICQNVFNYVLAGSDIDDQELLDDLVIWATQSWGANWAELASAAAELTTLDLDIVNADGTVARNIGSEAVGVVGLDPGANTSAAVGGYLMANTAIPKARGSKYLPGMTETAIDNGAFSAVAVGDLGVMLAEFLADIVLNGVTTLSPGVLSRTLVQFVPFVASGLINNIPAYQRRRKPGVGI